MLFLQAISGRVAYFNVIQLRYITRTSVNRIKSVDVLRTLAIISVIAIHTTPFESVSAPMGRIFDVGLFINQIARFAVPFFFVLSGYFWAFKFSDEKKSIEPTVQMTKRIAFIFIAWSAIYVLPMNIVDSFAYGPFQPLKLLYWNLINVVNKPLTTLMEGNTAHLWFLMSLLCSLLITATFLMLNLRRYLIAVAVILYGIGLAGKAYSDSPIGFHTDFNFRDGPFFSLIPFVTGYFLQRKGPADNWFLLGVVIAVVGAFIHFTELFILREFWGTTMKQDFVIGTYFFGVGVALVALSNTKYLNFSVLASIGPLVLGIYVSHFVFVEMLTPLDRKFTGHWAWEISYVIAVFALSYLMTLVLSKFRLTKRLVV